MRVLPAVIWARLEGVPVSREVLEEELAKVENGLQEAEARLKAYANIDWQSPQQVLKVLHRHGIRPTVKDTKGNLKNSTSAEALAPHKDHPIVQDLLAYRALQKRRAFLHGLTDKEKSHFNPDTWRLHPNWSSLGTVTGRMTSRKPNLQQVPRGEVRRIFRAPDGQVVIKADYSQIELRLAAAIASDWGMVLALRKGVDLHTLTASKVMGVDNPTKADRQAAKAINFGLIYGMGAKTLRTKAKMDYGVDMTLEEAERYRAGFFKLYRGLAWWHAKTEASLSQAGTLDVRTLLGRRRVVSSFREAVNSPVQGSGADGLKLALARLYERRHEVPGVVPILFVHDELVVLAPEEKAQEAAEWLASIMLEAMEEVIGRARLKVPIAVEYAICQDWGVTVLQEGEASSVKEDVPMA